MLVKMNDGRIKDVPVTEVTKENYIVAENAKNQYHCVIEVKKYDANTGKRLSVPRIQTFGKKAFANTVTSLNRQGYTVTVLYDPTEFLAEQKNNEQPATKKTTEELIQEAVTKALAEQEERLRKEFGKKRGGRKAKEEVEEVAEEATETTTEAEAETDAQAEETTEAEAKNNE